MNRICKQSLFLLTVATVIIVGWIEINAAENIDPDNDDSQYAYSENTGWLNAEPEGNGGAGAEIQPDRLVGWLWSENLGWISLACQNHGTGFCSSTVDYGIDHDGSGNLSGYAWGENIGWVSFSCSNTNSCAATAYGVTVDPLTGEFSGYGWGENIGWINFSQNIGFRARTVTRSLTVNKSGTGSGTVTSSLAGINCGTDCSQSYATGMLVSLFANTDNGSDFEGWSGACAGSGDCTITLTANKSLVASFIDIDLDDDNEPDSTDTDDDNDGIADIEEAAGPNNGDANNDSIPDFQQPNVASLTAYQSSAYIIMESPPGTKLRSSQATDIPSPEDVPPELDFPFGFVSFTIEGLAPGGSTWLKTTWPTNVDYNTYYKYGMVPNNQSDHWYEFLYNGATGAEIDRNVITLHFVDADRGDDILSQDSQVIDMGGPAVILDTGGSDPGGSGGGGGGGGCFIDISAH